MHPLRSLCVFWLLSLALMLEEDSPLDCIPRKSVPYHSECCYLSCVTFANNVSPRVGTHYLSFVELMGKQCLITGGF